MPRTPDVVRHAIVVPGIGRNAESYSGFAQNLRRRGRMNVTVHDLSEVPDFDQQEIVNGFIDCAVRLGSEVTLIGTDNKRQIVNNIADTNDSVAGVITITTGSSLSSPYLNHFPNDKFSQRRHMTISPNRRGMTMSRIEEFGREVSREILSAEPVDILAAPAVLNKIVNFVDGSND
jgi:hypothetical protein